MRASFACFCLLVHCPYCKVSKGVIDTARLGTITGARQQRAERAMRTFWHLTTRRWRSQHGNAIRFHIHHSMPSEHTTLQLQCQESDAGVSRLDGPSGGSRVLELAGQGVATYAARARREFAMHQSELVPLRIEQKQKQDAHRLSEHEAL